MLEAKAAHAEFTLRKEMKNKRGRIEFSHLSQSSTSPEQTDQKKAAAGSRVVRQLPIDEAFKGERWAAADDAVWRNASALPSGTRSRP